MLFTGLRRSVLEETVPFVWVLTNQKKKSTWHLFSEGHILDTIFRVRLPCGGFHDQFLHFKVENTPKKDPNGNRKFKRILSFLFVDKRRLFVNKLSFEEFHLVFFMAERLSCFGPTEPRHRSFWRNLSYILNTIVKESTFLKGKNRIYKDFIDAFCTFSYRRERKTTRGARISNWHQSFSRNFWYFLYSIVKERAFLKGSFFIY